MKIWDLPPKFIPSKKAINSSMGLKIKNIINDNPKISLRNLRKQMHLEFNEVPSIVTIGKYIKINKFIKKELSKEIYISDKNITKRLIFARKYS